MTRDFCADKNAQRKKQNPRGGLAKKKKTPLTERAHKALAAHGPATSDAIARRCKVTSRAASHALSGLKLRGRATYTKRKIGEVVWRALKPRTAKRAR